MRSVISFIINTNSHNIPLQPFVPNIVLMSQHKIPTEHGRLQNA